MSGDSFKPRDEVGKIWSLSCSCLILYRYYDTPIISDKNIDPFVRATCPSLNAQIRINGLGKLVRRLNMGKLVHNASKRLTAGLRGTVEGRLEEFMAPQAAFA